MKTISRHPQTFELITLADQAFNRGEVEEPLDYIDEHIQEFENSEKLYMDIQTIFEARVGFYA